MLGALSPPLIRSNLLWFALYRTDVGQRELIGVVKKPRATCGGPPTPFTIRGGQGWDTKGMQCGRPFN